MGPGLKQAGRAVAVLTACGLATLAFAPASALASASETWVADYGSDSNTGTESSPYADFATAVANTAPGGVVNALTPGNFGAVTITEPITINGDGNNASIDFTSSEGVFINSSTPGVVKLEDLDINGVGTGTDAVYDDQDGFPLEIDNCQLYGFTDIGVGMNDTNADTASVTITNTTIDGGELGVRTFQDAGAVPLTPAAITLNHDLIENVNGASNDAAIFTRVNDQVTVDNTTFLNDQIAYEADTQQFTAQFDDDEITGTLGSVFQLYTPGGSLEVDNSQISDNDGSVFCAVTCGGPVDASFSNDQIENNPDGGLLLNASSTLSGDTITGNGAYGVEGGPASISGSTIDDDANGVIDNNGTNVAISNSVIDGNATDGVSASGAGSAVALTADTISQNGTGLEADTGGTITEYGANNSVFGNTTNGSPTATVPTGAVGPQGPQGTEGTEGAQGSQGLQGIPGQTGPAGSNGEVELVTCKEVTKTKIINHKRKRVSTKSCTGKLESGTVKISAASSTLERASLSRGGRVYAIGSMDVGRSKAIGVLARKRAIAPGRYTLTLWNRQRISSRSTVLVR